MISQLRFLCVFLNCDVFAQNRHSKFRMIHPTRVVFAFLLYY
jgi:hypothetical protein